MHQRSYTWYTVELEFQGSGIFHDSGVHLKVTEQNKEMQRFLGTTLQIAIPETLGKGLILPEIGRNAAIGSKQFVCQCEKSEALCSEMHCVICLKYK